MGAPETIGLDTKLLIAELMRRGVEVQFVAGGLLKLVGFVALQAVPVFNVADHFQEGKVIGGRKIGWVGGNFRDLYYGLVEENVPPRTIPIWELVNGSRDAPVITIFGGEEEEKTQTFLAHTHQLMGLAEKGLGHFSGRANFSYKRSRKDGKLWVPGWFVSGGRFIVGADSSSSSRGWSGGRRVSGG